MNTKKRRLEALINLLDDPDHQVYETVEKELLKQNHKIIPALEDKWETSFDETCQDRIENLIQNLHFKQTKKQLRSWILSNNDDLLEGFICVDRFQYPDINLLSVRQKIENIRKSVWLELNNSLTLLEKITILNHFIFQINGFTINLNNIHSPQNCYLNQLLETKRGNPYSVGILYTILGCQLGLPVKLTDFPNNPLVAVVDADLAKKVHGKDTRTSVIFYVNPSNKGAITNRKEIDYHLKKQHKSSLEKYAEPVSNQFMVRRLLESLKESFHAAGFLEKEQKIEEIIKLFPSAQADGKG
ncbi:MAG: transglutaminase-like domain-containing protein [Prolixibacteraceae bacterium]|jgi:regulator of sirC expression with transglutaminase-like and TPR domain|nr:transglutaminase-like domain-containing protein [Prolixibacteraceae bacterium]MDD4755574.1 transglutaminase-like domain-containing protein [Prolixibacteraceae bacterium]